MELLDLPTEVLYQVFDSLREDGDIDSLLTCLVVCQALRGIVEHALYHTIAFRKRTSMYKLAQALQADPRRLRHVHHLELAWSCKAYRDDEAKAAEADQPPEMRPPDLTAMANLRRLLSESPECQPWAKRQGKWKPDMQNALEAFEKASMRSNCPAPRPLEHLRSLTLHWSGETDRFWTIKPSCPIFLHPTLRDIKMSCVCIVRLEADDAEWNVGLVEFRHRTPLESLHFEESLVSPAALFEIFSLPSALKRFEFEEVSHHRPEIGKFTDELIGHDIDTLNAALALQATSLSHLRIKSSNYLRQARSTLADIVLDLGSFRDLTRLELGDFHLRRGCQPWMLAYPLPPNLTELCVAGFGPDTAGAASTVLLSMLKVDHLIKSAQAQDRVFELEILLPKIPFWDSMPLQASISRLAPITSVIYDPTIFGERRDTDIVDDVGGMLPEVLSTDRIDSDGISSPSLRPRVTVKSVKMGGNYIPPYLHGERRPQVTTIIDTHSIELSMNFLEELSREQVPYQSDEEEDGHDHEHESSSELDTDDDLFNGVEMPYAGAAAHDAVDVDVEATASDQEQDRDVGPAGLMQAQFRDNSL